MKCLTVKEPWASLIAAGTKLVENRTWRTRHRGPLLIHRAKTCEQPGAIVAIVDVLDCVPVKDAPARTAY